MRGNEWRFRCKIPAGVRLFPIPMRGNEKRERTWVDKFFKVFPIPMRGNECHSLCPSKP